MALGINPSTSEDRKQLFAEIFFSKQDKVNKISNNSIAGALAYGVAKVSQKAEKDIIQALSQLFPDAAYSTQLDQVAQNFGISPRFSSSQSTTYVRVVGSIGTQYIAGVHTFQSTTGLQFDIEESVTIGTFGYSYVKVRSVDSGSTTNVNPGTITTVTPTPAGHTGCVNEYMATGGRDSESDIDFRQRIKNGPDILAKGTLAAIEQAFMLINNNVLAVRYQGINKSGQLQLAIITQNGIALNKAELNTLLTQSEEFLGLAELRPFGRKSYGLSIYNISVQPLDVSFRCQLQNGANVDTVRISIQTRMSKYLDPRFFRSGIDKVDWANLLDIARDTNGMKYVPDNEFYPAVDVPTDPNSIVMLRGFIMENLDGSVINDLAGTFSPTFYPANADFAYQASVLRTI